ncbi:hypothetical protein [Paractinoplanes deccanensis]|nr:hypothetical protein [Actinoplanes deccanensis]
MKGLRDERFLILTHPENAEVAALRATDPAAYLGAMSALWQAVDGPAG